MAEHVHIAGLKEQIAAAVATEREYTGCGFFTSLSVPQNVSPIGARSPIDGPVIESDAIDHGGAAILFLDHSGYLSELEMYANGDNFAEKVEDFALRAWGQPSP